MTDLQTTLRNAEKALRGGGNDDDDQPIGLTRGALKVLIRTIAKNLGDALRVRDASIAKLEARVESLEKGRQK